MISKKDLVIAVLATFCLTATLFMMTSTRSQTPLGTYDPWIDDNHDGSINILDAILLADHFGTSGDPTVNVNVTNWPAQQPSNKIVLVGEMNCSWTSGFGSSFFALATEVAGFSRAYLYVKPNHLVPASQGTYTVTVRIDRVLWEDSIGGQTFTTVETLNYATNNVVVSVTDGQVWGYANQQFDSNSGLDVKGPYLSTVLVYNATVDSGWVIMDVYAYLRNE